VYISFGEQQQIFSNQFISSLQKREELPFNTGSVLAAPLNIFNENIANSYDLVDCKGKYQFIYTLLKLKPECISPFSSVLLAFAQNSDLSLIIDLPGILYGFNDKKICSTVSLK